jgi:hypothetical protein
MIYFGKMRIRLLVVLLEFGISCAFRTNILNNIQLKSRHIASVNLGIRSIRNHRTNFGVSACAATKDSLRPVILAPAQFGVPDDYRDLSSLLESRGFRLFVAPLSRLDW